MERDTQLRRLTSSFTEPVVVRQYPNTSVGRQALEQEFTVLARHDYEASGVGADGGHINLGRTVTGAALTGGLSLLFGGSRTEGSIVVTYRRTTSGISYEYLREDAELAGIVPTYAVQRLFQCAVERIDLNWTGTKARCAIRIKSLMDEPIDAVEVEVSVYGFDPNHGPFDIVSLGTDATGFVVTFNRLGGHSLHRSQHVFGPLHPAGELSASTPELNVGSVTLAKLAVATPRRIQRSGSWQEPLLVEVEPALRAAAAASGVPPYEKLCPDCGETVKAMARICRFCRFDFEPQPA